MHKIWLFIMFHAHLSKCLEKQLWDALENIKVGQAVMGSQQMMLTAKYGVQNQPIKDNIKC